MGYTVLEATTGLDGVQAACSDRSAPSFLWISTRPGLDGYEATRRIKAQAALAHIPIIAVTSYALSGDDVQAFAAGCDGYVSKPFSPRALLATIRTYLR